MSPHVKKPSKGNASMKKAKCHLLNRGLQLPKAYLLNVPDFLLHFNAMRYEKPLFSFSFNKSTTSGFYASFAKYITMHLHIKQSLPFCACSIMYQNDQK